MSGGDLHVRAFTSYGTIGLNSTIDANSTRAGNMNTPVSVGGRQVFVTEDAAAQIRMLQNDGVFRLTVENDTKTTGLIFKKQESNVPRNFPEQFVGNPRARE